MLKKFSCRLKFCSFLLVAMLLAGCGGGGSSSSASSSPVYTTLFDAGSGGTRLMFFKVIPASGGYPSINNLYEKEYNDDGINDFLSGNGAITLVDKKGNVLPDGHRPANCTGGTVVSSGAVVKIEGLGPADVGPCVLEPLLKAQDAELASLGLTRSQVKVELLATAGMRTEERRNGGAYGPLDIASFYSTMRSYVSSMGFQVADFRTTNGNSEEGVWSWINLNDYYYNLFGGNATVSATVQPPVGDIEVGGSSMQIVFPVGADSNPSHNIYNVSINGRTFNVFSQTYLGLGNDDARKYMRVYGYLGQNGGLSCYATSATDSNTKEGSGIALYPTTSLVPNIFPGNTVVTAPWTTLDPLSGVFNFLGAPSYNYADCGAKYDTIIGQVLELARNSNGTENEGASVSWSSLKNRINQSLAPLVGISAFYWAAKDLGVATPVNFDKNQFNTNLMTTCNQQITNPDLNENVCPSATFMNRFLFDSADALFGNGTTASFSGVLAPKDADKKTVLSWTRGYLLQKYSR